MIKINKWNDPALTLIVIVDRKHSLVGARRQLISTLDAQIQTSAFHIVIPLLCFVIVCMSVVTAARYYLSAAILWGLNVRSCSNVMKIWHDRADGDVNLNKQDPEQHTSEPRKQASHTLICCRCTQVSKEKEPVGTEFAIEELYSLWMDPSPPKAAEEASVSGNNKKGSISLDKGGKFVLDL